MHLILPDDAREVFISTLTNGLETGGGFRDSLEILRWIPKLACDIEMHRLVTAAALSPYLGYRVQAASVLHEMGDDAGVLHLTYNALTTHPLLGIDQRRISASPAILRYASKLTENCIEYLLNDEQENGKRSHEVTLAQVPGVKVLPAIRSMLNSEGRSQKTAAYVLGMKGDDSGFKILESWLRSGDFPLESPLEALAHLATQEAISIIDELSDPGHASYAQGDDGQVRRRLKLLPLAQLLKDLVSSTDRRKVAKVMEKYYMRVFHEIEVYDRGDAFKLRRLCLKEPIELFVIPSTSNVLELNGADVLSSFSNQEDREYCFGKQKMNIEKLFSQNSLGFLDLYEGGIYPFFARQNRPWRIGLVTKYGHAFECLPDMRIIFDEADYLFAATNWLINPWAYQSPR